MIVKMNDTATNNNVSLVVEGLYCLTCSKHFTNVTISDNVKKPAIYRRKINNPWIKSSIISYNRFVVYLIITLKRAIFQLLAFYQIYQ